MGNRKVADGTSADRRKALEMNPEQKLYKRLTHRRTGWVRLE